MITTLIITGMIGVVVTYGALLIDAINTINNQ